MSDNEKSNAGSEHLRKLDKTRESEHIPIVNDSPSDHQPVGYHIIDKAKLAYGGIFYANGMKIMYRGATTPEIRHWSTMDSDNEFDIMEHFNTLLKSCLKITSGSWKDILEVDRFKIVLLIQEVTFSTFENPVNLVFDCYDCDTHNVHQLSHNDITANKVDMDMIEKYFDEDSLSMQIRTKDHGVVQYRPSSIGTADAVFTFIKTKKPAYVKTHSSIIMQLPRFMKSFRNVKNSDVESLVENWYSWNDDKLAFMSGLSDKFDFAPNETVDCVCSNCETINATKIDPDGNIKSMFLRRDTFIDQLAD